MKLDEIMFRKVMKNLTVLIEAIEIAEVRHALVCIQSLLIAHEDRFAELEGDDE
jgi:hypothetical protein